MQCEIETESNIMYEKLSEILRKPRTKGLMAIAEHALIFRLVIKKISLIHVCNLD